MTRSSRLCGKVSFPSCCPDQLSFPLSCLIFLSAIFLSGLVGYAFAALHCNSPTCAQAARNFLNAPGVGSQWVPSPLLRGEGSGRGVHSVSHCSLRFSAVS